MGASFRSKPSKTAKKEKSGVISKIDQEANKISLRPNTTEPAKSALKKNVKFQIEDEVPRKKFKPKKDQVIDESVFLDGFEDEDSAQDGSDSDSSDDDPYNLETEFKQSSAFDSKDLPASKIATITRNDKSSQQQKTEATSGVIYLGRIPHGFYEEEMKAYFSQFGEVVRLRLSRSRKTGKARHYGFIQFKHHPVAEIVAETLNNYLLCGNLLQCKILDQDQIHSKLWIGAGTKFKKNIKTRLRRERRNRPKSQEQQEVISTRLIEREKNKRKRLADLGIDYDFPGYANANQPKPLGEQRVVAEMKKKKKAKLDKKNIDRSKDKIQSHNSHAQSKKPIPSRN